MRPATMSPRSALLMDRERRSIASEDAFSIDLERLSVGPDTAGSSTDGSTGTSGSLNMTFRCTGPADGLTARPNASAAVDRTKSVGIDASAAGSSNNQRVLFLQFPTSSYL